MKAQIKKTSEVNVYNEELPHYAQYLNTEDIHNNYYSEEETEEEKELKEVGKNFNEDYFI